MKEYLVSPQTLWGEISVAAVEESPWFFVPGIHMTAQLCYNEDNLFVRMQAVEEEIRAELNSQTDMICQDSCMEFFFAPKEGDRRYFNVEMNLNAMVYLGYGTVREERVRLLVKEPDILFDTHAHRTDDGWVLTYRIPASLIRRFFPEFRGFYPGLTMRANFMKCGDLTRQPHYLMWNSSTSPAPDFHRYDDFGLLRFV